MGRKHSEYLDNQHKATQHAKSPHTNTPVATTTADVIAPTADVITPTASVLDPRAPRLAATPSVFGIIVPTTP